jgi:hypothetical protein
MFCNFCFDSKFQLDTKLHRLPVLRSTMDSLEVPEKQKSVLDSFHQSALRHFERAHMLANDLDVAHRCPVTEQSANYRDQRCKQWVLNESGQCPSEVASWDGSINYDSHEGSGRLDSCSAYAGLFDSYRSAPAGIIPMKTVQSLESWTSSRSPSIFHAQTCAKPEHSTNSPAASGTELHHSKLEI